MVTINTIDAGLCAMHLLSPPNHWIAWRQSGQGPRALPEPRKEHVMQVSIVDAFTRTPGAGNRAGVVLDAAGLDAAAMQRIAAAVGASETAFVLSRPGEGAVRLRYFTPTDEIEFCGHATVASFHLLSERGLLARAGHFRLDCAAGTYDVDLEPVDARLSRVWIVTPQYPWRESPLPIEAVMPLLGGTVEMVDRSLPVLANGHKLFV